MAQGVPLTINLTVLDLAANAVPLAGGAVYLWQCDREGRYSMYSQGVTNENYLRGVQEIDASGKVSFTSVFPGCYAGRWPHIHFEVYRSLASATAAGNKIATSQIALPEGLCDAVYASSGYGTSATQPHPRVAGERHGLPRRLDRGTGHGQRHGRLRPHGRPQGPRPVKGRVPCCRDACERHRKLSHGFRIGRVPC